ncbi:hypothetical protein [Actinoallomurus vinaceus]|uniref:hypothetical protein n=1 Tax=Actinoallomurus vinaceus TaxID=1080074 RepID=UPI0031EB69D3
MDVIARRAGNMARRREKAWRWEHWGVVPDRVSQRALAVELGIPEECIDRYPWPQWLPDGDPIRTDFTWNQAGSSKAICDAMECTVTDRRGFMKLTGTSLIAFAQRWLDIEPAELASVLRGGRITEDFVDRVEEGLPRLRLLEATYGGRRSRRLIDAELGMVAEVLENSSYTASLSQRLHGLAAELGRMVGFACFDAGLHTAAQRYWVAAVHASHAAGQRALGANILKSMSLQCHDFGRVREALALARNANEGAGKTTPRVRSMLALREARAHAALDDAVTCERLIARADTEIGRGSRDDDPPWVAYFDEAEFHAQAGICYLDLGDHRTADRHFTRALDQLAPSKVRDRATYLIKRSEAQAGLGAVDHAKELLTTAIPLIQQAPSQRNADRVFAARTGMPLPRRDSHDIDEQLVLLVK